MPRRTGVKLHKLAKPVARVGRAPRKFIKSAVRRLPKPLRTLKAAYSALALIVIVGLAVGNNVYQSSKYHLNRSQTSFLSHSSVDASFIKQDSKGFSYDRSLEQASLSANNKGNKQLTVSGSLDATGIDSYKANLPKNPKDGITFSDSKGTTSFNIKPTTGSANSSLLGGRLDQSSVVYPSSTNSNEKHIYSFKKNGIKEDILLTTKPSTKVLDYTYTLTLNSDQEARLQPDGSIGIYIANPNPTSSSNGSNSITNPNSTASLLANTTASDDKSSILLSKARQAAEANQVKDYLVYVLPKPFIVDNRNVKNYEDVSYKLEQANQTASNGNQTGNNGTNGATTGNSGTNTSNNSSSNSATTANTYTLTLEALNMLNKNYPLSIDPTITVTTTADFRQGTDDGMLD
jgi:hypothetical protein